MYARLAAWLFLAIIGLGTTQPQLWAQASVFNGTYSVTYGTGTLTVPGYTFTFPSGVAGEGPISVSVAGSTSSVAGTTASGVFVVGTNTVTLAGGTTANFTFGSDGTLNVTITIPSPDPELSAITFTVSGSIRQNIDDTVSGGGTWSLQYTDNVAYDAAAGDTYDPSVITVTGGGSWSATRTSSVTTGGSSLGYPAVNTAGGPISGDGAALGPYDRRNPGADSAGGPVDTASGAENFSRTLIALAGLRPLEFPVNYNSVQVAQAGDLGYGWSHEFLASATPGVNSTGGATVALAWSQNRANTYTQTTGSTYISTDEAAQYDVLTATNTGYVLTKPDQTKYTFTTASGGSVAYLTQIANRTGQALTISRNAAGTQLNTITEPVSGASLTFTYTSGVITKIADSAGRTVALSYDGTGMLNGITDVNGHKTSYAYDANHRLTTVTAADGSVIFTNTYDAQGRVATQADGIAGHAAATYSYDEVSQPGNVVTTVTDHLGAQTVYVHDAQYHFLSVTDPLGGATTYAYDTRGDLTGITDALGRNATFTYDGNGNPLTAVDALGKQTTFTYDASHNVLSVVNAAGGTATFTYDGQNDLLKAVDFAGGATVYTYGTNAVLATMVSARSNTTTYGYTGGRLTAVTDPAGNKTTVAYDGVGRVTGVTDPTGAVRTFAYSASGQVTKQTDPLGNAWTYAYDARDRRASATDPLGGVTTWAYDANDNILSSTNALGGVTQFAYDGQNRPTRATDPRGNATAFAYDAVGRLTARTDPLGNITHFAYDAVGNLTGVTDPLGNPVAQMAYDARNQPVSLTDALGRKTVYTYDALRRLSQSTDPLGNATGLSYDALSRLVQSTDPLSQKIAQGFDADGNRTSMTNALGAALTFAYDNVDRLTTQTSAGGRITTYAYDARSLLAKIVDPTGNAAVLTCDAAGRLTKLVDPLSEVDTTYDAKNRRLSVVEGAKSIGYAYDALDRLTRFTDANGNVLQYDYDANGNLITLTYPDGKKVTYTYDADNRLATVTDWVARVTQYTYDADSRLVKTVRPNGTVQTQTFDAAGQLTGLADTASDHSTIVQCAYTYDAAGKRLATTRSPAPSVYAPTALTLTYDVDDRLTAYAGQAVSANLNGDMLTTPLSGVLAPATYDARDRLASAGGITYTYDAENRRLQETAASATTTYVVNPNAPLSQLLVSTTSGGSTTRYVYGLGLIYQDTDATTVRYLHADAQGSTVALTEAAGTVTGRVDYGPYGEIIAQTGDTATAFQYLGQAGVETDGNGLVFMRARTYNPQVRRFLQPDPWLGSVAVPGSADRYAYVGDNPANRTDVRGFNWLPDSGSDFNGPVVSGSGSPAPGTVSTDEKGWTQPFAILPGNGAGHGPTKGTLDALDNTLAGAGVVQTGAQYGNVAGIATLGSNLKFYQSGWGGGSVARITTTKVAPLVEDLGGVLTLGSLALDSYNYNKGTVSAQKLGTDTIVAGVGTFGGLAGAAVSVIYTGVDKLYPGGWLGENGSTTPYHGAGLLADYGTAYARAQAVTPVPIFSLY